MVARNQRQVSVRSILLNATHAQVTVNVDPTNHQYHEYGLNQPPTKQISTWSLADDPRCASRPQQIPRISRSPKFSEVWQRFPPPVRPEHDVRVCGTVCYFITAHQSKNQCQGNAVDVSLSTLASNAVPRPRLRLCMWIPSGTLMSVVWWSAKNVPDSGRKKKSERTRDLGSKLMMMVTWIVQ